MANDWLIFFPLTVRIGTCPNGASTKNIILVCGKNRHATYTEGTTMICGDNTRFRLSTLNEGQQPKHQLVITL
jgi:hypothetical protein